MHDRAAIDQVCHARNVNESAHFNQRHHGVLQSEAFRFEFPCTARGRDIMRRTENDAYFRKWARQNESVPAFRPPAARILQVRGKNRGSRSLRQQDNAGSKFINWTARPVRSDDNIAPGSEHFAKLQHGRGALARTGSTHDIEPDPLHQLGDIGAVATGADQRRALPVREKPPQDQRHNEQTIVPDRSDGSVTRRSCEDTATILDDVAQRFFP